MGTGRHLGGVPSNGRFPPSDPARAEGVGAATGPSRWADSASRGRAEEGQAKGPDAGRGSGEVGGLHDAGGPGTLFAVDLQECAQTGRRIGADGTSSELSGGRAAPSGHGEWR